MATGMSDSQCMSRIEAADELALLWDQWICTGESDYRDRLVEQYLPLMRRLVEALLHVHPDIRDLREACRWGRLGLVEAVTHYRLSEGVPFDAYCERFVRRTVLEDMGRFQRKKSRRYRCGTTTFRHVKGE